MKRILFTIAALCGFFIAQEAKATCDIASSFTDGAVLTAAQLNTLVTSTENCVQDVLDGDTFTGVINLHSSADIVGYTDTGSTKTFEIDGATGDALLAPRANGAYGLSLSLSSGTLTIQCRNAACSSANPGYVVMNSTTAGQQVTLKVTSGGSFIDDVGSSDLTNLGFGITEASHWANDAPFFLYAVNRGNSNFNGSDGSSMFFLARNPALSTTPSSANDIGDTGAIPSNDGQNVILILADVTIANYTSLPVELIGAIRMQWSTTSDDWTVQTIGQNDGVSNSALDKTFKTLWTFPLAQNGASSGTFLLASGGSAPLFSSNNYSYTINRHGVVSLFINISTDPGTDGAGAVVAKVSAPYGTATIHANLNGGMLQVESVGGAAAIQFVIAKFILSGDSNFSLYETAGGAMQNGDFSNGSREINGTVIYKAF